MASGLGGCDLAATLSVMAGADAVDCGAAPLHGNRDPVDGCSAMARRFGTPFRGRYTQPGYDGRVEQAIVGTPHGEVYFLAYDGDPCGGGRCPPALYQRECKSPTVLTTQYGSWIDCAALDAPVAVCR